MHKVCTFWKQKSPHICEGLILLAVWTGLEPATPCVTGRYSNQLNYQTNDFIFTETPTTVGFKSCSFAFLKRVQIYILISDSTKHFFKK